VFGGRAAWIIVAENYTAVASTISCKLLIEIASELP
jgi:hypothetical protein